MKLGARRHFCLRAILALASVFLAVACARPGPQQTAQDYLQALESADYGRCYELLPASERAKLSPAAFAAEIPLAPDVTRAWFSRILHATDYRVNPPRTEGITATVPVDVLTPNVALWQRQLGALNPEARPAAVARQLREHSYPVLSYRDNLVLVKEHRRWWISDGFEIRGQVDSLREKAVVAYHGYDFKLAVSLYKQLLAMLAEAPLSGSQGLSIRYGRELMVVEAALRQQPQEQAYLSNLLVQKLSREPTNTGQPGMFGEIRNAGARALDQVRLRVSYYPNSEGQQHALFYEEHTPLALPIGVTDFSSVQPELRPGDMVKFGFPLTAPADMQLHAKAVVSADAVIFSDASIAPPKLPGYVPRQPPSLQVTSLARSGAAATGGTHRRARTVRHRLRHHRRHR
jgi:hypothetical protein